MVTFFYCASTNKNGNEAEHPKKKVGKTVESKKLNHAYIRKNHVRIKG